MKHWIGILWVCLSLASCLSQPQGDEALLAKLDQMIENRKEYQQTMERKIRLLRKSIEYESNDTLRLERMEALFQLYRTFRIDTAYYLALQRLELAKKLNQREWIDQAHMNVADALNKRGSADMALQVLEQIDSTAHREQSNYYYYLLHTTTLSLYEKENNGPVQEKYREQLKRYKEHLIAICPPGSQGWVSNQCGLLNMRGETDEAIRLLLGYFQNTPSDHPDKAQMEYLQAELYLEKGDREQARHWLIQASITDIKEAKKVYMSLQRLAMMLYEEGDVERAYRYITCSLEDISFGKARYRLENIANYLTIIHAAHDSHTRSLHHTAIALVILLVLIVLVLIAAYWVVHSRNTLLQTSKRSLAEQNEQLQQLTERLIRMNEEVRESNHIKEEYIGMLFNTCSNYICQAETTHKRLLKAARTGTLADVNALLHTPETDGFKSFITQFDTIFLSIFPDFIESFNQLLRPEEQIHPKEGELLTPDLRIYALIRLGITDNAKIAAFLHYSLQTVYNYRLRMRSRALNDGHELVEKVKRLCVK